MLPTALPQRLTGEVQPVRGGCVRHPSCANFSSCGEGQLFQSKLEQVRGGAGDQRFQR